MVADTHTVGTVADTLMAGTLTVGMVTDTLTADTLTVGMVTDTLTATHNHYLCGFINTRCSYKNNIGAL